MRLALGPCLSPGYSLMPAPGFLREDGTLEGLRPRPEPRLTRRPSVPRPASLWVSPSPLDCIPQRSSQEAPREALLASPVFGLRAWPSPRVGTHLWPDCGGWSPGTCCADASCIPCCTRPGAAPRAGCPGRLGSRCARCAGTPAGSAPSLPGR